MNAFQPFDYGQAVGQGIANASNTVNFMNVAQQMQQRDQATGLSKKAAAGDSSALAQLAAVDPQSAVHIQAFRKNASDAQKEEVAARALKVGQVAQVSTDPQSWDANMVAAGFPELQGHFERRNMSLALAGLIPKALTEPYTLKPGETRYGADNKPIASVPEDPKSTLTGWTFMRSQDGSKVYRMNPNVGEIQVRTTMGWAPDPNADVGSMQKIGDQGTFGSSMNMRFVNRVSGAANEGLAALVSMSGMRDPNSGIFSASAVSGAGGKHLIAGILTDEGVKRYNATIAGLAPEIAAAQNQGMVPHDEQIRAVEQALTISPTDNLTTKQYRIALGARYLRKALEVSRDLASPDQQKTIDKLIKQSSVFPDPDKIAGNNWQQGVFKGTPSPEASPNGNTSDQDAAAIAWAKANPNDPRSRKILELNNAVQP